MIESLDDTRGGLATSQLTLLHDPQKAELLSSAVIADEIF